MLYLTPVRTELPSRFDFARLRHFRSISLRPKAEGAKKTQTTERNRNRSAGIRSERLPKMPPFPPNPSSASHLLRRLLSPPHISHLLPPFRSPANLRSFATKSASSSPSAAFVRDQKSRRTLVYLVGVACAMVGASYAAVPLYRRFCQATGYGGTVQRRESVEDKIARHARDGTTTSREIVVQFNADVADGMPWKFVPTQREVRVKPGESALAFYTAENRSSAPITGVSTYNVTPMKAAVYFNKIQCFCFEEQCLLPGEQIDMPVFFYIDPEFETDPKMDGINNIILSYTFFKANED